MTPTQIAKLRELLAKATPRPWRRDRNWSITGRDHDWDRTWPSAEYHADLADYRVAIVNGPGGQNNAVVDGDLIVAIVNAAPALLDAAEEAERLRAERDEARVRVCEVCGEEEGHGRVWENVEVCRACWEGVAYTRGYGEGRDSMRAERDAAEAERDEARAETQREYLKLCNATARATRAESDRDSYRDSLTALQEQFARVVAERDALRAEVESLRAALAGLLRAPGPSVTFAEYTAAREAARAALAAGKGET